MNTAWLVMHRPYLRHLRERLADGGRHTHEAGSLLPSVFSLSTQLLAFVYIDIAMVGTHAPAAYSDVAVQ